MQGDRILAIGKPQPVSLRRRQSRIAEPGVPILEMVPESHSIGRAILAAAIDPSGFDVLLGD